MISGAGEESGPTMWTRAGAQQARSGPLSVGGGSMTVMSGTDLAIETHGLVKVFGDQWAVDGVDLAIPTGGGLRRARAQRRRQDHHDPMLATLLPPDGGRDRPRPRRRPRPARGCARWSRSPVSTPRSTRTSPALENLGAPGPALPAAAGRRPRGAPPSCSRPFDLTDAADRSGEDLLGRHAPPPRPRRLDRRATPTVHVPRRADHRPRPAQPQRGVGDRPRPGRRRHRPCC